VLAGLLPAIRGTRADLHAVLKSTELRFARSRGRMRQALVVAQVAAALVMLILSGLFLKSIQVARNSDPGFRVANVLTMGFDPRIARYDLEQARMFYRQLLERVRALPGVRSAALGQQLPLGVESSATEIAIDGYQATPAQERWPSAAPSLARTISTRWAFPSSAGVRSTPEIPRPLRKLRS
jgi:hypothetical protein